MKKISILVAVTMVIVSYSCKKSTIVVSENPTIRENTVSPLSKEKTGLCVENNVNTLTNTNGEWSCPSPAKDCGKISPCAAISGGGNQNNKLHETDLTELDAAIAKGALSEYLSTPEGANFFKRLLGGKGPVFSRLISEELTVVKKESATTGNAYYLVIAKGVDADRISAKDVFAAYEYSRK